MTRGLRERLIGAWKLVSYVEEPVDGSAPFYPLGEEPQGIIMYTPDGNPFSGTVSWVADRASLCG